ncbi:pyridoxamine 5'-phosphate oxidase family protein [Lacticaseibacillus sp. N501-2]|uniref:pyridoxamine 5'-phosphate oxidase family protein n=1 Tax=Lacticaseibacillus salsurae TaxID=3367729 RepID=UPI0038B352E1
MATKTDLERIVNASSQIAVATLTEDGTAPDVRIVLGVYDAENDLVLFMSSGKAEKAAEIAAHKQAAFATPQFGQNDVMRVRKATVTKITPTQAQQTLYTTKYPQTAKYAAHSDFFALAFDQAEVTIAGTASTVDMAD